MDIFLNRINICYINALLTNDIDKKISILNNILPILKYYRSITDFVQFMYVNDVTFIKNMPHLILLTYDLEMIAKSIGVSDNIVIYFENNNFYADYKQISPLSNLSNEDQWS